MNSNSDMRKEDFDDDKADELTPLEVFRMVNDQTSMLINMNKKLFEEVEYNRVSIIELEERVSELEKKLDLVKDLL